MGIAEKISAIVPWRHQDAQRSRPQADALALRQDFDRWLERFVGDPWAAFPGDLPGLPKAQVEETGDAVLVRAEVPGLDEEDLDLRVTPQGLTIRGEKREERKDKRRDVVEWRYGSFVQTVPLPPGIDAAKAEARVKNGVLSVKFPKAAAREGARRIPVAT